MYKATILFFFFDAAACPRSTSQTRSADTATAVPVAKAGDQAAVTEQPGGSDDWLVAMAGGDGEDRAPDAVERGFRTIVEAIERARAEMRPGVVGEVVDRAAREHIVGRGYEEFPHGLGHQVGRFAHDGTALLGPPWEKYVGKVDKPLEEGMVFTIEPRLTIEGYGVATVENMVVVTPSGADYLSTPQEELLYIRS